MRYNDLLRTKYENSKELILSKVMLEHINNICNGVSNAIVSVCYNMWGGDCHAIVSIWLEVALGVSMKVYPGAIVAL